MTPLNWRSALPGTDVSIQDLVTGHAMLMAINTSYVPPEWKREIRGDETVEVMNFLVDGVWLSACQNPDDGYRSSMQGIKVIDMPKGVSGTTRITATNVRFMHDTGDGGRRVNDVLVLLDEITEQPVLAVGTTDADDYYPCWLAQWAPENLASNRALVSSEDKERIKKERYERKAWRDQMKAESAKVQQERNEQLSQIGWATW
ncbi:hypothetical protein [Cupriavidus campinensis]|uniref:Uncharacterized protein n=1 Tax=Cupriavidus campinensis TaxID=151783 RepID=A0ABY3ESR7_9BURK|nr:hypothetical protein [Cupriavidus campinensis]TSP14019.1 hypothetical protein FGG12_05990 [Cupriavidus campinensis]